ncbi:TerD family protein [Sphingomonas sp. NPDC079357]|uniref:TerD family protein n=1 Tax=Sphingomonas sp. NPDC079357 TaxID=3364518 RepID=UPI00384CB566
MGANAPIDQELCDLQVTWPATAGVLDCSAFVLGADGRVRCDDDMIFFNQPEAIDGSVRITALAGGRTDFSIDLGRVASDVERIVICAVLEGRASTMRAFRGIAATLTAGDTRVRFEPEPADERALRLVEFYRRVDRWKVRADGQGFNDGLGPLARSFGVDVADDGGDSPPPSASPLPPPPAAAEVGLPPAEPAPAPRPRTFAPPAVSERRRKPVRQSGSPPPPDAIRLDGNGVGHRWRRPDSTEDLIVRLAWSSHCGGADGRARPLTLTLGAFHRWADGDVGAIQADGLRSARADLALGDRPPLRGDGEQVLTVRGSAWDTLDTLVLYAVIDGAPSWRASEVTLTLAPTGQPAVISDFAGGEDGCGVLGLARLDRDDRGIHLTRLAAYAQDQLDLDETFGWGLAWRQPPLA